MNKNEKGFSLIIVAIFMSIAALFIGYLMGSWLISFLVNDQNPEQRAEPQTEINKTIAENDSENKTVNNQKNNLTAPPQENKTTQKTVEDSADSANSQSADNENNEEKQEQNNDSASNNSPSNIGGSYGVQIGAFSNYNNALKLKNEIVDLGYDVVISESSPHQVKVIGYQNREKAEEIESELKKEGYNGFIVIQE